MSDDPISKFSQWLADAEASEPNDPNAMALATVDAEGRAHVRMVLLKGHGEDGFVFYTNAQSDKARHLAASPDAALLFHWKSLRRQVRVEGRASRVTEAMADAYFASRGRDSQLGAWASDQSRPLDDRATFEKRFTDVAAQYGEGPVPRPPHWSGFSIVPERMEFWEDRPHRLHHRVLYERAHGGWRHGLLYP